MYSEFYIMGCGECYRQRNGICVISFSPLVLICNAQGGYITQQTGNYYYDVTLPVSSYLRLALMADTDSPTITTARYDTSCAYGIISNSKIRLMCKTGLDSVVWLAIGT